MLLLKRATALTFWAIPNALGLRSVASIPQSGWRGFEKALGFIASFTLLVHVGMTSFETREAARPRLRQEVGIDRLD